MVTFRKQRKRGSWRTKHRNDVSRWHICIVEFKYRRVRPPTKMYDSVEECLRAEMRHGRAAL